MQAIKKPTFTAGICDNFALEVHLKIFFKNVEGTVAGYEVTKTVADIVYGKWTPVASEPASITRKTSLTFLESESSRLNSGSPGYIKGVQLKTGQLIKPTDPAQLSYINEPVNGFPLLGADNSGQCYSMKVAISDELSVLADGFIMDDINDSKYFEDPLLTFDDSIVTGCHLDLNYQELNDFCDGQKFKNLVLF